MSLPDRSADEPNGFGEAPQTAFTMDTPLTGPVSDWAAEIARAAEAPPAAPEPATAAPKKPSKKAISDALARDVLARVKGGLNAVSGLDVGIEDAASLPKGGATATVEALSALIASGNPLFKEGKLWTPHRPERPAKSEGGISFKLTSPYSPQGDQPTAIAELVAGVESRESMQVLLGVTGSGKTFTMAKVIEEDAASGADPCA